MTPPVCPQERPIRLWVDGELLHTFYGTPRDLPDLAMGYLFSRNLLDPSWNPAFQVTEEEPWTVRAVIRGVPKENTPKAALPCPWPGSLERVVGLAQAAMENTPLREKSGGVHAAAIGWGKNLVVREDVARHNAVDKAVGAAIIREADFDAAVLFTTGRLSHEMLVKAAKAGIPVAATMKYPTDLGVALAAQKGISLVGRTLSPQPVVYTGHWRLGLPDPESFIRRK